MTEEKFVLRMPEGARNMIKFAAAKEYSSMNGYILRLIGRDVEKVTGSIFPHQSPSSKALPKGDTE